MVWVDFLEKPNKINGGLGGLGQKSSGSKKLGCVMTFVRYREDQWLAAKL
jgi:hypothetical protein